MMSLNFSNLRKRHIAGFAVAIVLTIAAFVAPFGNQADSHEAHSGKLTVDHPFAYETIGTQKVGAAFMTILNNGDQDDRLVSAKSPVAGRIEIHTHSKDAETGVMRMRRLKDGAEIPGKGMLRLEPGGHHLMLFDLKEPLITGIHVPVTLVFEKAGAVETTLAVESRVTGHKMHDQKGGTGSHSHH